MKRYNYFDWLKIFACFNVIIIHVASMQLYTPEYGTSASFCLNFWHGFAHFAVTVFFLISGALYLSPNYTIKPNYGTKILKYISLYLIYAILYSMYSLIATDQLSASLPRNAIKILENALAHPYYHLWYLPAYVAVLFAVPFIKLVLRHTSNEQKVLQYMLLLWGVLLLTQTIPTFDPPLISGLCTVIRKFIPNIISDWVGVCVLGYYLSQYSIKHWKPICVFSTILFFTCIILSYFYFGEIRTELYDNLTVQTTLAGSAVFLFFQNCFKRTSLCIKKITGATLGIYLIHPFILSLLEAVGINGLLAPPILTVPIVSVLIFGISMLATMGMQKIPFFRKLLL